MSKRKNIGIGLILTAGVLTNAPKQCSISKAKDKILTYFDNFNHSAEDDKDTACFTQPKPHIAQKVYHRFEEIPEITDEMALFYQSDEYTYIMNADIYRQTGKIKLKRVLKDEITQSNVLSILYRAECPDYIPNPNEDQLVRYDLDPQVISPDGIYKGPSQMNDDTIKDFIKYLATKLPYRAYIIPMLKTKDKTSVSDNLIKLEKKFFTIGGKLRSREERKQAILSSTYKNLTIDPNAWKKLVSPEIQKSIIQKENSISGSLSGISKNYLYLTEKIPSRQLLAELETYNLNFYTLRRPGRPQLIVTALAHSLNLKDKEGKYDASRVPTYAIGAAISHINWKGNGSAALSSAIKKFSSDQQVAEKELKKLAKTWVNGKAHNFGIDEQAKLNMLTPEIINQYKQLELPGAENLAEQYKQAVKKAERNVQLLAKKRQKKNNLLALNARKSKELS